MKRLLVLSLLIIYMTTTATGYIPVEYSCCKNHANGTLLADFENMKDWKLNGLNSSYIIADKTNFKEGKQGLKLVSRNGDKVFATKNMNMNLADVKNFVFDAYVDDKADYLAFYLTSSQDWSRFFYQTVTLKKRWNHFTVDKDDMINLGGEDWNNTMTMFRLSLYPVNTTKDDVNVTIDNFKLSNEKGKIIFTFDDGTTGDLLAEKILTSNNQKAVSFITINWLNNKNFMTLEDLKYLQNKGWDISSHSMSHPDMITISDNAMATEMNDSYDWLVNNGFRKSAIFFAYPYGHLNHKVIEKAKQRYILARSVLGGRQPNLSPGSVDKLHKLKIMEIRSNTTVQSVKDRINSTLDNGSLLILLFHRIVKENPGTFEYNVSNFKEISDSVNISGIEVKTFSDYMIPDLKAYTPIINKTSRIHQDGSVEILTDNMFDEYMPNMTIKPSLGSININVTSYNESGGLITFKETTDRSIDIEYSIGDRIPRQKYSIKTYYDNIPVNKYVMADKNGYINYHTKDFGQVIVEIAPSDIGEIADEDIEDDETINTIGNEGWLTMVIILFVMYIRRRQSTTNL